jgi:hypothetical protein
MTPVETVFSQTPCHDATKLVLAHNGVELRVNEFRCIPGPEELVRGIEVVLPAGFPVRHAVRHGRLPGACDVGVGAAGAKGMLTCAGTVFGGSAAVAVLGAAACGAFCAFFGPAGTWAVLVLWLMGEAVRSLWSRVLGGTGITYHRRILGVKCC